MTFIDASVLICSILPLVLLLSISYLFYKKNRPLEAMVFFATSIHEGILVSFPNIYSIFNDYRFEKLLRFSATPSQLLKVLVIENVYLLVFLTPFLLFSFCRIRRYEARTPDKVYKLFVWIVSLGIVVYIYQIINRPTIEDIVESYSQSGLVGSNKFVAFFTITLEHTAIICSTILSVKTKNEIYPKSYQYLGILMLFLALVLVLVTGVRGRVIWVAEFVILIAVFKRKFKPILIMVVLGLLFIPINNILVHQIRPISEAIAKEGGLTNDALLNIGKVIIEGVNDDYREESSDVFTSLAERAQGPRNSIVLISEYEKGNAPGLNLYSGAIFFFIPRFLIDRPVIGSPNDDFKEAAIYKVMDLNYENNTFITMGPLLGSAHAYWEGGFVGVFLIALISSALWILLFIMSYRMPLVIGLVFSLLGCCALLIDGFITCFTPLYALVSLFWKNYVLLLIGYFIFCRVRIKGTSMIQART